MFVYSQAILEFLGILKQMAKAIMKKEMGLEVHSRTFLFNNYRIPLSLVVFEREKTLGYFDYRTWQIGINKKLLYCQDEEFLKNILRHELAHMMCYLQFGQYVADHGQNYHEICRQYGWGEEVWKAVIQFTNPDNETSSTHIDLKAERILERVKKLLSLASSDNTHEADLATIKANELLIRHNLESFSPKGPEDEEEDLCVLRVMEQTRCSAKMEAIYEILTNFLVSPVFNRGKSVVYLEVTGTRANVLVAEYVAKFLEHELDEIWEKACRENENLKSISNKNIFMKSLGHGYSNKIKSMRHGHSAHDQKGLVTIEKDLKEKIRIVYRRLSSHHSSSSASGAEARLAKNLGEKAGKSLQIRSALKDAEKAAKKIFRLGMS